jgi:putative DNA primase/helicase
VRDILGEAANVRDSGESEALVEHALQSQAAPRIKAMIDLARSEPGVAVSPDELDADPWALNVLNGTVDLRTGELRCHRREDLITKIASVEYRADARSDLWNRFLERTIPDGELRRYAQKIAGYTLAGAANEDVFFIVYGPPRTGKGTFQDALASCLRDYAVTAELDLLAERDRPGGPRPELVRLRGARMVSIYEASRRLRLSASLVKSLAGSDPIAARDLYARPITFRPQCTIWLASNYRPTVPDEDDALWERIRELPFREHIAEEERDPGLRSRLRTAGLDLEAVLAWTVEGCLLWQREGLGKPEIVRRATMEFRRDMDPLKGFFEECCVLEPTRWTPARVLRSEYEKWASENGERVLSGKDFGKRLVARGCKPKRLHSGRGWQGIKLIAGPADVTP